MKITDLRIGDRVQNKTSKFPMTVVDIISDFSLPINPNKGTVYLDFEGNEGDVWEENVEDLEFCEPRYKLPEWKPLYKNSLGAYIDFSLFLIKYEVAECDDGFYTFFFFNKNCEVPSCKRIGKYPTLEKAKAAAEKHYNELVSEIIEKLISAPLPNEASKTQHND